MNVKEFQTEITRMRPRSRTATVRVQKEGKLFSVAAMISGMDKNGIHHSAWLWAITDKRPYDAEVACAAMKVMLMAFLAKVNVAFFGVPFSERDRFMEIAKELRSSAPRGGQS